MLAMPAGFSACDIIGRSFKARIKRRLHLTDWVTLYIRIFN
jgi:hypothetical protein